MPKVLTFRSVKVRIGSSLFQHKGIEIWARPITPVYQNYFSYAIAFVNRRTDGTPSDVSVTLKELGLQYPGGYSVEVRLCTLDFSFLCFRKATKQFKKMTKQLLNNVNCFIGFIRGCELRCLNVANEDKSQS